MAPTPAGSTQHRGVAGRRSLDGDARFYLKPAVFFTSSQGPCSSWEQLPHRGPDWPARSLSWNIADGDQLPWEFPNGPVTTPCVQVSGSQPRRPPTGVCEGPEAGVGRERDCRGPLGKGR